MKQWFSTVETDIHCILNHLIAKFQALLYNFVCWTVTSTKVENLFCKPKGKYPALHSSVPNLDQIPFILLYDFFNLSPSSQHPPTSTPIPRPLFYLFIFFRVLHHFIRTYFNRLHFQRGRPKLLKESLQNIGMIKAFGFQLLNTFLK